MGEQINDLTYCELRAKEIINTFDGRRLGRIVDIVFSSSGSNIKGIVVPYDRRLFFSRNREIFIPWNCINKIGEDVILVSIKEGSQPGKGGGRGGKSGCYGDYHGGHDCDDHHHRDDCGDSHKHDDCGCDSKKHDDCGCGFNTYGHFGFSNKNSDKCHDKCSSDKHCDDKGHNKKDDCRGGDRVHDGSGRRESLRCDKKCEKCMLFDCSYRWKD